MENYIVRIYRRDEKLNTVAGVVEVVETQEKKPFTSNEELHAILDTVEKSGTRITWETK